MIRLPRVARSLLCLVAMFAPFRARRAHADGVEPLPNPLRVEQAMQLARSRRAEIIAVRARARASAQRPAIVSALDDPMIIPAIDHLPFMPQGVDASLNVEQRFPLSRILGHRRRAAEAAAERSRADADRVGLDVDLDAAAAFFMLKERRAMAVVLQEQRGLAEQFVKTATARYAAGTGVQADALRAEIEVARLDGALRSIAAEIHAAEAMLNTSLGRRADAAVPPLDNDVPVGLPPPAASLREVALDRRPELRAGRSEIGRARAEVSVMKSMYAPMAMVRTGPAYTMADGWGWMLMAGISVPIWRGKLRAGVAEAEAMVDMSRADLEAMRRMVDGEAVSAREQVAAARERLLAQRDQVIPRARQAIDATLASYITGQLPLVSVIDTAQTLWTAQAELVSAELALGVAWARLKRAIGDDRGLTP